MIYNFIDGLAKRLPSRHCEEPRRGNLEVIDILRTEIASLRSQRRLKGFFSILLVYPGAL